MSVPIHRRNFLQQAGKGLAALALCPSAAIYASPSFDLLLKGGLILDGTGGPPFRGDIAVAGDTIMVIGTVAPEQARRVIDISRHHVAPGFIDIHSHSDTSLFSYPKAESRVRQGVTTEITGNCGSSAAPWKDTEESRKEWLEDEGFIPDWNDVASYFKSLENRKFAVNQALLLGQGTLRSNIVGLADRKATTDELRALLRAVEEGMEQGAIGLSTGLEYSPGLYTPTEEIVEMTKIVARRGGLYASHIRNEESGLLKAVEEAIDIGRKTGARVEISHLKAAGKPNWVKQQPAIAIIEAGRKEGIAVLGDAYPYTAYSTGLTVLFEPWVLDGGTKPMMDRLKDSRQRAKIREELIAYVQNDPGSYDLIVISNVRSQKNRPMIGKNMMEIAELWKTQPVDAVMRLIEEEEGSVSYVGHGMSPENVETVLAHPLVMISSDGYSIGPYGKAAESRPHPRSYATYPRVLAHYVRERKLLDLPVAIKKMTSMPADQVGLKDRGRIARGKKADLVVFDPASVKEVASFSDPHHFPEGIQHVIINGMPVLENGVQNEAKPGRILRF